MKNIYIGTSGWHYKHWIGTFYPSDITAKQQFEHYAKLFDTVEINNSFYKLPPRTVFEGWYKNSPKKFLFVIKANRFITHNLKLTRPTEPLTRLFNSILALKEKLGPILFQLPPKWKVNVERLKEFLKALPAGYSYVFEFRNDTWYNEEVYKLLQEYNCAFCIYELGGHMSPIKVTANFVYLRLHGPLDNKYQGSYSKTVLRKWAKKCLEWQSQKKKVYVYFDNDQEGYAAFNAITLKAIIDDLANRVRVR
ncbi:MAG: DUF72 domain-containing protein [Niastella sp.]|uniref:DUF72 domain-containing protein n=1 Tax=Niastella sp. TaxID=1869183 RepID=UPI00389AD1D5